jgi:para-aminobenzoate synthetase component 1
VSAATGGGAPLVCEMVPAPDPLDACVRLTGWPHRAWLDSATRGAPRGRYSVLTADPWAVIAADTPDPLAALRGALAPLRTSRCAGLPPFQGGAIGYLAYEFGRRLERVPVPRGAGAAVPDVWFGLYDWALTWDHLAGRAWLIATGLPETSRRRARRAADRAAAVRARLAHPHPPSPATARPRRLAGSLVAPPDAGHAVPALGPDVRAAVSRAAYLAAVERARRYILDGDVFQVNIAQHLSAPAPADALAFYRRLRDVNPAPFAAYLEPADFVVASASPERFLHVAPGGAVETRPIKGTRPRGRTAAADAALGAELLASDKDRAENVMIVDLLRNDLSRVCRPGSVAVPELCGLERYATVQHLVSTVTGQLDPARDPADLLAAAFPGGSITGAPKIRAMEIIAELEPAARGVYCGAIGYWSVTGAMDMSIAIRTTVVRAGRVWFGAGGGIVADSVPEHEYAETLHKARGLVAALP